MTDLLSPVTRRATNATVFERGTRRILVTLYPPTGSQPEQVGFRLERTRREYRVNLPDLYWLAVKGTAAAEARALARLVSEKVKAGHNRRTAKMLARRELKGAK